MQLKYEIAILLPFTFSKFSESVCKKCENSLNKATVAQHKIDIMQKHLFITQIQQHLAEFAPFSAEKVTIDSFVFVKKTESVAFFVDEIEKTAELLSQQEEVLHIEYYVNRLLTQFDLLNKALEKVKRQEKNRQFNSSFQFSSNIHRLPPDKRLIEYRKALRALNEKISWLIEQNFNEKDEFKKSYWQDQITETEYRKIKCLTAIEDLEHALQFKS